VRRTSLIIVVLTALGLPALAGQATLTVTSTPSGARVSIRGIYRGLTPLTIKLNDVPAQARAYPLTLSRTGYQTWRSSVRLKASEHRSVRVPLRRATPPALGGKLTGRVICLDPGHPSEATSGTTGKKVSEIKVNWLIAVRLKALLEARGARVILTKASESAYVTNRKRAEIANAAHADLFLRLHCDAASSRGLAVYYPEHQGTKQGVTGPSQAVMTRSSAAAHALYPVVVAALQGKVPGRGLHTDNGTAIGGKQGALTGSIFSQVPVVLVEMVVLTNATDEAFITSEAGQKAMAEALAAGVAAAVGK
jgi:N-acetylmuramoyl-L-alanine amidase